MPLAAHQPREPRAYHAHRGLAGGNCAGPWRMPDLSRPRPALAHDRAGYAMRRATRGPDISSPTYAGGRVIIRAGATLPDALRALPGVERRMVPEPTELRYSHESRLVTGRMRPVVVAYLAPASRRMRTVPVDSSLATTDVRSWRPDGHTIGDAIAWSAPPSRRQRSMARHARTERERAERRAERNLAKLALDYRHRDSVSYAVGCASDAPIVIGQVRELDGHSASRRYSCDEIVIGDYASPDHDGWSPITTLGMGPVCGLVLGVSRSTELVPDAPSIAPDGIVATTADHRAMRASAPVVPDTVIPSPQSRLADAPRLRAHDAHATARAKDELEAERMPARLARWLPVARYTLASLALGVAPRWAHISPRSARALRVGEAVRGLSVPASVPASSYLAS